ncbi:glycosyltransferase family 2 protein [Marinimicrobium sp. C6131]|uniref:glycosyltransferase family 2 protein n=1 Tax=Marinimicrobium sp. C6131 TaxID=3022676 RepID=UPI00223DEE98|nr:glycosyltransferase family 2 protein [Marinimicrobium sp. C6131]UZJ43913.1 glycosyltransferase family 2 protein [Marinimicrobium sp. C6131]
MSEPLVSVIIPVYNRQKTIARAIDSVLNQSYKNTEIIVVDDGSIDLTEEVVKNLYRNILYIKKNNGGPASARNIGLKNASGDYIAYLDSDDTWPKDKLLTYIETAKKFRGKNFLIFSDHYRIDKSKKISKHSEYYSNIHDYIYDRMTPLSNPLEKLNLILEPYTFYPSTFMLSKEAHKKLKWRTTPKFNEDLFFVLDASRVCDFIYIDRPLMNYYCTEDSISDSIGESSTGWSELEFEILNTFRKEYMLEVEEEKIIIEKLYKLKRSLFMANLFSLKPVSAIKYGFYLIINRVTYKRFLYKFIK